MSRTRELAIFCHKMEQALHAGFDLEKSFLIMQDEQPGVLSKAIKRTYDGIRRGQTLSLSMRPDELTYTSELVDMVYVTEQTGHIELAFHKMAERLDRKNEIEGKVKAASVYPIIVLVVFIIAVFAVAAVYKVLPVAIIITVIIALVIVSVISAKYTADTVSRKSKIVGNVLVRLPFIGKQIMQSELADFADNMAMFYSCGVPVDKGLEYSAKALSMEVLRDKVLKAASYVRRGNPLSTALLMQGIFPPDLTGSLKIGEESGNVDGMLEKIAEYYRQEVKHRTDVAMSLIRQ